MANGTAGRLIDLAEGGIERQAESDKNTIDGVARQMQQAQQQRQQLESKRQLIEAKKDEQGFKDVEFFFNLRQKNPKMANAYIKRMERTATDRGRPFAPEFLEALKASDADTTAISKSFSTYQEELDRSFEQGSPTPELAEARAQYADIAHNGNIEALAGLELQEKRTRITADAQAGRQQAQIRAQAGRQREQIQGRQAQAREERAARPQLSADNAFAKELVKFDELGGKAELEKNIGELDAAIADLERFSKEQGEDSRSIIIGSLPDLALDIANPELAKIRDQVRGAIQSTLRQTLGAQFTEQEGEKIFRRAFNPRLSNKENIRRARATVNGLKAQAEAKRKSIDFFREKGTLKGFRPNAKQTPKQKAKSKFRIEKEQFLQFDDDKKKRFADRFGVTVKEIEKQLGIK